MKPQVQVREAPTYKGITACRLCGGSQLMTMLDLGNQFIVDFPPDVDPLLPQAPLILVRCHQCGLMQLNASVDSDLLWKGAYWYRSGMNQTMKNALADVVNTALQYRRTGVWLDIGANDGTLLQEVTKRQDAVFAKIACEPSPTFHAAYHAKGINLLPDYFSAEKLGGQTCDVITSCAMFYDLDDPNTFVADIAKSLNKDGIWINQLSDAESMVKFNAFDSICHEHRCYYDNGSLNALYARHGLSIIEASRNMVNGGSIRIVATRSGTGGSSTLLPSLTDTDLRNWVERIRRWKILMSEFLLSPSVSSGSLWAYGASTKGLCLTQFLGHGERIAGVADRSPAKWGRRMVGSWIPITDEVTMRKAKPDWLLVLPWAFRDEFLEREKDLRATGTRMIFPLPNLEVAL